MKSEKNLCKEYFFFLVENSHLVGISVSVLFFVFIKKTRLLSTRSLPRFHLNQFFPFSLIHSHFKSE